MSGIVTAAYNLQGKVIGHQQWRTTLKPTTDAFSNLTLPLLFKADANTIFVFDFQSEFKTDADAATNNACLAGFCEQCVTQAGNLCKKKVKSFSCQVGDTCICSFSCADLAPPQGGGEQ